MRVLWMFFALVVTIAGQKPSFAPNRPPGPSVLPQYEENVAAAAAASILGDRFGAATGTSQPSSETTTTPRPLTEEEQAVKGVYPGVDDDLLRQISQWPKERQPFWYLNAAHIQSHRGQPGAPGFAPPATTNNFPARSSFQRSN